MIGLERLVCEEQVSNSRFIVFVGIHSLCSRVKKKIVKLVKNVL